MIEKDYNVDVEEQLYYIYICFKEEDGTLYTMVCPLVSHYPMNHIASYGPYKESDVWTFRDKLSKLCHLRNKNIYWLGRPQIYHFMRVRRNPDPNEYERWKQYVTFLKERYSHKSENELSEDIWSWYLSLGCS